MNPRATCISRVTGCAICVSPSARVHGIERGDLPRVVLNLHRRHNAFLLSPSRRCLVSPAFGERSGEGPSKPFESCWFMTALGFLQFPIASQHASPKGAMHHSEGLPSLGEATLVLGITIWKANPAPSSRAASTSSVSTHPRRFQHDHHTHGPLSIRFPFIIPASAFIRHSSF